MVMLRATKSFRYATRNLVAGDEFEAHPQHARTLRTIGRAEDAPERPAKVARPKNPTPEPAVEPAVTRAELLAIVEERGLELPGGYVSHATLVDLIAADDAKDAGAV